MQHDSMARTAKGKGTAPGTAASRAAQAQGAVAAGTQHAAHHPPRHPRRPSPRGMFAPALLRPALVAAFRKLSPRDQLRNPVMFVVYVGSILTTILFLQALFAPAAGSESAAFILAVAIWLWFTVLFANFAEALAEGRSKQQAQALRGLKTTVTARVLRDGKRGGATEARAATALRRGDVVLVEAGDMIPGDGEVIDGVASVDESAITGESAPVIRESGGDFSSVTGGTRVLSDWIVVRITTNPGESFIDRMITMVEGAKRQKTPNELALTILLVGLTLVLLLATATLQPFSLYAVLVTSAGVPVTITVLVALLVCLIPTTIGGLLSAIGVAGMSRMMEANVIATSGRAVEAAGDVDVLLLDKTGTITHGNRQAARFIPAPGVSPLQLAQAAWLSSLADETPEGRSIVTLARQQPGLVAPQSTAMPVFVPFSAQTRMSGIDLAQDHGARQVRKGAADAVRRYVTEHAGKFPDAVMQAVDDVARAGSTPLVVADANGTSVRVLGVIELKDIVKTGIRERFGELRKMGIRTVMITGDNRLTAASIAAEAGVDDFLAEATPEAKLSLIRQYQADGRLVAMTGDGTNDAPALAQADVAVAMNSGTQAAKEAGNMVDLDSNPTKLIEIVEIGKQMLMTRGSLTTFSVANDIAKYFAIIPAAFATTYPQLNVLNVMGLATPASAIMSAVIFNALIIVVLIPLALKGVVYRPLGAAVLLRRNLLIYGLGGILVPFAGIKLIDMILALFGWV
ncbi:potassium-transporting ATPase subunit KdpB [Cupriavidus taiwanensis]|uniref:potassium-transporting ATPase subunit KdpB n=1 Tax=Cupriavidus taiwanensis TaxID=164546 RepID=UPI000E200929